MDTSAGDTGDNMRVEDMVAVNANTCCVDTWRTSSSRTRTCSVHLGIEVVSEMMTDEQSSALAALSKQAL